MSAIIVFLAMASIGAGSAATADEHTPRRTQDGTQGASGELSGRITNAAGEPIHGAMVTDGRVVEVTGADGMFSLPLADIAGESLQLRAAGYADITLHVDEASHPLELSMEQQPIKAIYLNPTVTRTDEQIQRLIDIINATEVNAIVIDVKEELIFYETQVAFFRDLGVVNPVFDMPALLEKMNENDIYTIARHVVFKDSLVAERRPDLAVRSTVTGGPWRDMNSVAWVNPMLPELWDVNIEFAVELAELGFDEIQYDYVRFPTDGDTSTMDFGVPFSESTRTEAITGLLERTQSALLPTGAKLSADVFGYTLLVNDDLGIGQDLTELAPLVDYLSPMTYPSHYPNGSLGLPGHPNDFPYETIQISLDAGAAQLGSARQLRPWLQDFLYYGLRDYGPADVRAQIDAAQDAGASGWMIWDPTNEYSVDAFGPDDGNMRRFTSERAILPGRGGSVSVGRKQVFVY